MQIYLDTANLGELREAASWGILSGVTTNPSLMAKERGVDFKTTIQAIAELVDGPISAETVSLDADGMVREGREYAQWHPNVIVKVPSTTEGLKAVNRLAKEGIRTNVTLCFNANQALFAARGRVHHQPVHWARGRHRRGGHAAHTLDRRDLPQ